MIFRLFDSLKLKVKLEIKNKDFREIVTGSVWALGARLFATGLSLLTSVIVARIYGAELLGIVALLNSFLLIATIFALLGTSTSIMRLIPEHRVKYSATSALWIYRKTQFLVLTASVVVGMISFYFSDLIAENVFSKKYLMIYFSMASVFLVFKSLALFNTQALRGLKMVKVYAGFQAIPQLSNLFLLIIVGFVVPSDDVPIYSLFGSLMLTGILGWIVMELSFKKITKPQDKIHAFSRRHILSLSTPMFMTGVVSVVSGQFAIIMIAAYGLASDVGVFSVAVKLATLTGFIFKAINTIVAPKIAELYHADCVDELFVVIKKTAKLIFWTTTPILVLLLITGKYVLINLYGDEFGVVYPALVLLLFGQFINSITGCTGIFMNMAGHQKAYRNIILFGAVISVFINAALIPLYGFYGAAFAVFMSEFIWNLSALIFIKKHYGRSTGYMPLMERVKF